MRTDGNNVTALPLLPLGFASLDAKANSCANVSHGNLLTVFGLFQY